MSKVSSTIPRKALIVTALAGFVRSFLMPDIATLQGMGFEVHCAANAHHAGANDVVEFLDNKGVIFHQVDFSSSKPVSKETLAAFEQLRKLSSSEDFSFVHCHTPIAGALCRAVFRKRRKDGLTKVAYTTHGFYFHKRASRKTWMLFYPVEDLMSRWSDVMITINREDYSNALKMHCDDVRYIPGVGVDIDKFHKVQINRGTYRESLGLKQDDFVILAVGEISARKNQHIIVEALAKRPIPHAVFVVCGNFITGADIKKSIEKLARKGGVDVRFLGRRPDIPEICKCVDVGVLPSMREGLGLAGIEMLASGLPLIGSNVHGIPDYLIDGQNGVLCDPWSVDDWAEALQHLYSDSSYRVKLGSSGYESVKGFSLAESEACMRHIYSDLLSRKGEVPCA